MVDLNICRPGDILSSSHGAILKYIESLGEDDYMDHKVQYLKANNVDGNGKRRGKRICPFMNTIVKHADRISNSWCLAVKNLTALPATVRMCAG